MGSELIPVRGRIYMADIGAGRKPWLVVSNNARNRALSDCLAVRLTNSVKPDLPSIIQLGPADPLVGRALCDDVALLYRSDLEEDRGALSPATMVKVAAGLRAALAL
ncbi:type II toxin-antitoxin system PemK/MazF family toxin [Streptomyces sp. H10-C2]|uniref:type II toxin-antitoxin system PemK/MazF family toxin n=1 Tax=unclassified Streptomyces TaxID=2593676 RepID=UPI0024BA6896|nr:MULTISPECIES: type II toxin-antitoxin system PemK/MazF family toxin [unclassified Streptomyces]MDJ0344346.1 type II toxin-antitoxin system PemK/MazF family toxin [Streptomyces sp. PH10-H1]MDJ0373715.1 type II toxin-antitoxin system PemK/MazF family toxin [Streptomyces sp. H10-C2]